MSHWPKESNRTSCPHPHFKYHRLVPRLMVTFYNLIAEDNTYVIKHGEGKVTSVNNTGRGKKLTLLATNPATCNSDLPAKYTGVILAQMLWE